MPYMVSWLPGPLATLAHIWNQAPDRQAVADAADRIDWLLQRIPTSVGVPTGSVRRLRIAPLEVVYSVSQADQRVEVLLVLFRP
ncbi:MAG TPA: hypothetical protein VFW33_04465 [Gemmataceae bacterium]|nr:hypothetical protein [Gemmataceae bacterium]